jgi:hypothetical protein
MLVFSVIFLTMPAYLASVSDMLIGDAVMSLSAGYALTTLSVISYVLNVVSKIALSNTVLSNSLPLSNKYLMVVGVTYPTVSEDDMLGPAIDLNRAIILDTTSLILVDSDRDLGADNCLDDVSDNDIDADSVLSDANSRSDESFTVTD